MHQIGQAMLIKDRAHLAGLAGQAEAEREAGEAGFRRARSTRKAQRRSGQEGRGWDRNSHAGFQCKKVGVPLVAPVLLPYHAYRPYTEQDSYARYNMEQTRTTGMPPRLAADTLRRVSG